MKTVWFKAVSCSTGLELSPRPRTCLGVALHAPARGPGAGSGATTGARPAAGAAPDDEARDARNRGKLDKSHSTPAYDFDGGAGDEPGSLVTQIIPESPTTPTDSPTILVHSAEKADQILDFKKSSSQIGEAILQQKSRRLTDERNEFSFAEEGDDGREAPEAVNAVAVELLAARGPAGPGAPPEPPPRPPREPPLPPAEAREYPALRAVRAPAGPAGAPLKPLRPGEPPHISGPLRHISKHDARAVGAERREPPPLNAEEPAPPAAPGAGLSLGAGFPGPPGAPAAPAGGVRAMFPAYKSKSLKKKNSLLASEYRPFRETTVFITIFEKKSHKRSLYSSLDDT